MMRNITSRAQNNRTSQDTSHAGRRKIATRVSKIPRRTNSYAESLHQLLINGVETFRAHNQRKKQKRTYHGPWFAMRSHIFFYTDFASSGLGPDIYCAPSNES
jgi:hypothetical protein